MTFVVQVHVVLTQHVGTRMESPLVHAYQIISDHHRVVGQNVFLIANVQQIRLVLISDVQSKLYFKLN